MSAGPRVKSECNNITNRWVRVTRGGRHGIPFDEKNVSFEEDPRPVREKIQADLREFCQA